MPLNIEKALEDTKRDFQHHLALYQSVVKSSSDTNKNFLIFKLAIVAFLGGLLTIMASVGANIYALVLSGVGVLSLFFLLKDFYDIFRLHEGDLRASSRDLAITNIRYTGLLEWKNQGDDKEKTRIKSTYIDGATLLYNEESKVFSAIRARKTLEETVSEITTFSYNWKSDILIWGAVTISSLIIFCLFLIS